MSHRLNMIPSVFFHLTFDDVKRECASAALAGKDVRIFTAERASCYWTHRAEDVLTNETNMPRCPLGSPIIATPEWRDWLAVAEQTQLQYGRYGIQTFMAAHHANCRTVPFNLPVSFAHWRMYDPLIDVAIARPVFQARQNNSAR